MQKLIFRAISSASVCSLQWPAEWELKANNSGSWNHPQLMGFICLTCSPIFLFNIDLDGGLQNTPFFPYHTHNGKYGTVRATCPELEECLFSWAYFLTICMAEVTYCPKHWIPFTELKLDQNNISLHYRRDPAMCAVTLMFWVRHKKLKARQSWRMSRATSTNEYLL